MQELRFLVMILLSFFNGIVCEVKRNMCEVNRIDLCVGSTCRQLFFSRGRVLKKCGGAPSLFSHPSQNFEMILESFGLR